MTRVRARKARQRYGEHLSPHHRFDLRAGSAAVPSEGDWLWSSPAERRAAWETSREYLIDQDRLGLELLEGFWQYEAKVPAALREHKNDREWLMHPEPDRIEAEYRAHIEARRAWLQVHGWTAPTHRSSPK